MIIFINDSINSGKSAVAKTLAEKIERPAIVETDQTPEETAMIIFNLIKL